MIRSLQAARRALSSSAMDLHLTMAEAHLGYCRHAVGALRASLLCCGSSLAMLSLSPSLFAVSVLSFPAAVLVARRTGERIKAQQREVQDALATAGAEADRALGNVRTLKLFAAEQDAVRVYEERVEAARRQAEAVGAGSLLLEASRLTRDST